MGGVPAVRTTEIRYSSRHSAELVDLPMPDLDADPVFTAMFAQARPHTMTHKETLFALYQAARHVAGRGIPGDFVECGVWKGGSALMAGLALRHFDPAGVRRQLWLYDTFTGMTAPTAADVDVLGVAAQDYLDRYADDGRWCHAAQDGVGGMLRAHGFGADDARLVAGDVLQTLRHTAPDAIAILRLDTDWYESTLAELQVLYPRLATGGVLIVDDYGHWAGARQAVDEYFTDKPMPLFNRVNYSVRMAIKA